MENQARWPPDEKLWGLHRLNEAWYSGESDSLAWETRGFWKSGEKHKMHVPIGAELAALAAGFLFSGSPTITTEDKATNGRLQQLTEQTGLYQCLLQAAELQSVYGGVFLKLNWDKTLVDHPLISVVPAPGGMPVFQQGIVRSIDFWSEQRRDDKGSIWRLKETYTTNGQIVSALYLGDAQNMGSIVSLDSIPETKGIKPIAKSGTGKLLAVYIPNRLPNKRNPFSRIGSSDFEGLYDLFSALDEAYSSLMRDVRLSKTRVIVPMEYLRKKKSIREYLDANGNDEDKWAFSISDEVFVALDIEGSQDQSSATIEAVQPLIRAADHLTVVNDLIRRIYMLAGYSPQSAGIDIDGQAESGTALNVRERRSMQTAETKKTYWWHALVDFMEAMLHLDKAIFHSKVKLGGKLSVTFADNTQPDMQTVADTLDKIERAHAASLDTKVRMLHPDWENDKIADEVKAIREENGMDVDDQPDASLGDLESDETAELAGGDA